MIKPKAAGRLTNRQVASLRRMAARVLKLVEQHRGIVRLNDREILLAAGSDSRPCHLALCAARLAATQSRADLRYIAAPLLTFTSTVAR